MFELPEPIEFEWDDANREKNWIKHQVTVIEVEQVFFNQQLVILEDEKHSQDEVRLSVYGITDQKRLLNVIITLRAKKIRIISARDMSRKERQEYAKY